MGISSVLGSWGHPWRLLPPSPLTGLRKAWLAGIASPGMPSITALGRGGVHCLGGTCSGSHASGKITVKKESKMH